MASELADVPSSTTILSEDELLGHTTHLSIDHDLDEEALLGGADVVQDEKYPVEEHVADSTFDREELDYDEDEDQDEKPERSKFASERPGKGGAASATSTTSAVAATASVSNTSTTSSGYSSGRGNYNNNNNNFRRRGGFQNRPNLPSLLGMQVCPPPHGGKILVNPNFIPNQQPPLVRLNMPGSAPITMCPPMPSAFIAGPTGPIVPRLPNGIPLVALPPNHGVAGFGAPPPPMPMRPPMMGNPGNWDQAVNAFLNPTLKRTRRRSSSYSSYSSSGSSRSRSPRRRRGGNGGRREEKRRRSGDRRSHRREERRRDGRRDYGGNDRSERRRGERATEECAKAVGVDHEYLDRIEEQKRRRDELLKKKEQRRFSGNEPEPSKKSEGKREVANDKKAHLCVVIRNMKHLPTAQQKIEKLAAEIGPITKCWRYNEDIVHLIFADHSNAKAFLVKFNGKVLSGLRMQVHVEKAYLNLSEIK